MGADEGDAITQSFAAGEQFGPGEADQAVTHLAEAFGAEGVVTGTRGHRGFYKGKLRKRRGGNPKCEIRNPKQI